MKSDRLSKALLKDFVARIKAKKITRSLLKNEVCEKVVNDLVRFEKRCLRPKCPKLKDFGPDP